MSEWKKNRVSTQKSRANMMWQYDFGNRPKLAPWCLKGPCEKMLTFQWTKTFRLHFDPLPVRQDGTLNLGMCRSKLCGNKLCRHRFKWNKNGQFGLQPKNNVFVYWGVEIFDTVPKWDMLNVRPNSRRLRPAKPKCNLYSTVPIITDQYIIRKTSFWHRVVFGISMCHFTRYRNIRSRSI